jgi:hypothetical protein
MATKKKSDVAAFVAALEHPLRDGVVRLRQALLAVGDATTEQIKWNAPSFCDDGDDRCTMRLTPTTVQLILHRGAKVKSTAGFAFVDDTGLVTWAAPDRGVITFKSIAEVEQHEAAVAALVGRWFVATRDS